MKKMIIGIVIGITITLIGGFIVAKAATSITSTQVLYSNSNSSATTVKAAIDELMTKTKTAKITAYTLSGSNYNIGGSFYKSTFNLSSIPNWQNLQTGVNCVAVVTAVTGVPSNPSLAGMTGNVNIQKPSSSSFVVGRYESGYASQIIVYVIG